MLLYRIHGQEIIWHSLSFGVPDFVPIEVVLLLSACDDPKAYHTVLCSRCLQVPVAIDGVATSTVRTHVHLQRYRTQGNHDW